MINCVCSVLCVWVSVAVIFCSNNIDCCSLKIFQFVHVHNDAVTHFNLMAFIPIFMCENTLGDRNS